MSQEHILDLWEECNTILNEHFVYDKIFDLFDYDTNLEKLYAELAKLKKERYDINYRFIFLHYDTDYYIYLNTPGILLTNLQTVLTKLDIPNYFCLIVTNHTNLEQELIYLQKNLTNDHSAIGVIVSQLQNCHVTKPLKDIDTNSEAIKNNYCCFNYSCRGHRTALISLLYYKDFLKYGTVSYVK
jgi:hypothetical protein